MWGISGFEAIFGKALHRHPGACSVNSPEGMLQNRAMTTETSYHNTRQGPAGGALRNILTTTLAKKRKKSCTSRDVPTPLAQVCPGHRRLSGEDGHRNGPITGGQVVRTPGNDIVTVQALVLDTLVSQELSQAARGCDGAALAALVLIQSLTHGA